MIFSPQVLLLLPLTETDLNRNPYIDTGPKLWSS